MRQSGISLVELLVSVTILALATTVALVVYDQARLAYTPLGETGSCFRITFAHPDRLTG